MFHQKNQLFAITFCCAIIAAASPADAQRRKSVFEKEDAAQPKVDDSSKSASGTPKAAKTTDPKGASSTDPPFFDKNKPAEGDEFAPEVVTMPIKKDGVSLVATWFPPIVEEEEEEKKPAPASSANPANPADPNAEQEELPEPFETISSFILIHDWSRTRKDLIPLAEFLQSQGHAVIVPDLRGHGDSVEVKGIATELDYKKFTKTQQASAVADIDQCKRFLQRKNNEKVLNIDLLNVIAVGDSCHLAMAWSINDWSWEPVGGIKQGKDVKSLTLFSPTKTFAGSTLKKLIKSPLFSGRTSPTLPMLVVWGGQSKADRDCSEFIKNLRKNRPEMAKGADLATRWANQDLFDFSAPTAMGGREIAGSVKAKTIWKFANDFVSQKVLTHKEEHPWKLRGKAALKQNNR